MMSKKNGLMNRLGLVLATCALAFPLSGCTGAIALINSAGNDIFLQQDVNLTEKNYAAADYLAGLTLQTLNKSTPVYVGRLNHANQSGITSAFASVVPEQVGARFAQLGYNVHMPTDGMYGYTEDQSTRRGVILTGTYLPNGSYADIALRLVDNRSGRILGAFDYTVPVNTEIAGLLEARPTTIQKSPSIAEDYPAPKQDADQSDVPLMLLGPAPK